MTKTCPTCGSQFGPGKYPRNFKKQKFCGWACAQPSKRKDMETAFWEKVNKSAPSGCWEWTASRKEKGYGQFFWRGKMNRAHRLAWTLSGRELPAKPLELAHRCHNRICVNPDHLYPATHAENMAHSKADKRHTWGERNSRATLTAAQVLEIRARFKFYNKRQTNADELAAEYGVNRNAIYLAATRRTWKMLP